MKLRTILWGIGCYMVSDFICGLIDLYRVIPGPCEDQVQLVIQER